MELTLTLTVDEINYILQSLGQRPFAEVQGLIVKIKDMAEKQIASNPPALEVVKPDAA
jgi:hypothetical protein